MDKIIIEELTAQCILGCYPEERVTKQTVVISITLFADLFAAGISDQLEDTINYHQLQQEVQAMVENSSFELIEKMVQEVAGLCLVDRRVAKCVVRIDKPMALSTCKTVGIEIEREQALTNRA